MSAAARLRRPAAGKVPVAELARVPVLAETGTLASSATGRLSRAPRLRTVRSSLRSGSRGRLGRGFFLFQEPGQLRLLAGRHVRVDDPLGRRLVELAGGQVVFLPQLFDLAV